MTEQQKIAELEAKLASLQSQQREPVEKPAMYIKFGNKRNGDVPSLSGARLTHSPMLANSLSTAALMLGSASASLLVVAI